MHKCNSTLNTLSSIANQSASLPLAMRFLLIYIKIVFMSELCLSSGKAPTCFAKSRSYSNSVSVHFRWSNHEILTRVPAKAFFLVTLCLFFQKEFCTKNEFDMHENELVGGTNFYMNGCARLRLFLAQRQKTTGKWSITESFRPSFSSSSHLHLNNSRTYAALVHDLSINWLIHLVIFCIRLSFFSSVHFGIGVQLK